MRFYFILFGLFLAGCSEEKTTKVIKGPEGVAAEIIEARYEASAPNNMHVDLVSKDGRHRTTIFDGTDGSDPNVTFFQKMIIIQYCYPTEYDVKGYVYNVGDEYSYSDIRVTVATVESTIGHMQFCKGGMAK